MRRKGMGKGKGKGYKNIMGKDPLVHSQSARGMKQPQRVSPRITTIMKKRPEVKDMDFKQLKKLGVFLRYHADSDKDGVPNIKDCKPLNPKKHKDEAVTEIEFDPTVEEEPTTYQKLKGKTGAVLGKAGRGAVSLGKKGVKSYIESRKQKKIEALREVKHPKIRELEKQQMRVAELQRQAENEPDDEDLFRELDEEEDQLRKIQEEVTEIKVEDLNDAQLKTLAIRHKDDFSIFGSGNPYKDELLRRIRAKKKLEKEISEAKSKKPEKGILEDLF